MTSNGPARDRWALVAIVVAATMVAQAFGRFTYALVLPSVQRDLGISYTLAGTLGTSNLAAYLVGSAAVAALSTRLPLDRLMKGGIGVSTLGLAGMWWAPNLPVVAVAMIVTGLAGAFIWIPATAVSSSLVAVRHRGLAIGLVGTGIGFGFVTAGWAARITGGAWQSIYGIEAAVGLATAMLTWTLLRAPTEAATRRPSLRSLTQVPSSPLVFGAYGGFGLSMSLFVNFFVARLDEDSGYTTQAAAAVFAAFGAASIFGGPVFGPLSDRLGRRLAIQIGFASMSGASLLLLIGTGPWPWVAAVAFGLAFAGVPASIAAHLRDHLSAQEFGAAFGVITLAFGTGQLLAPQLGGLLADTMGSFTLVFQIAAAVALASGGAAVRVRRADPAGRTVSRRPAPPAA